MRVRYPSAWENDLELIFLGPNEQRTISREDIGFYHAVIVGGIYEFTHAVDFHSPSSFFRPLRRCVEQHPYLCVTVGDMHTDKSFYRRVPHVNLEDHVFIENHTTAGDDSRKIEAVLAANLDKPFSRGIPPWRIIILPLQSRCFIAFAFSHTIGDGISGPAFHRTFLQACASLAAPLPPMDAALVHTPVTPLPPPFDTRERLPISWKFLLAPLMGLLLPSFIANLFGLRASASGSDEGTWTGRPAAFDSKTLRSNIILREVEAPLLERALLASRRHDAKLTSTFHQLITRALSEAVPDPRFTNFVSATAVNMRRSIGVSNDEMGEFTSGCYITHPRADMSARFPDECWLAASSASQRLTEAASTLQDQAIGLLRYLPSVRRWMLSKLGKTRDGSFEVSNIGVFDPRNVSTPAASAEVQAKITKMVFAQPGHVDTSPLAFNIASVKGGSLVYTVTWQAGALGVGIDEELFVDGICTSMQQDLETLE